MPEKILLIGDQASVERDAAIIAARGGQVESIVLSADTPPDHLKEKAQQALPKTNLVKTGFLFNTALVDALGDVLDTCRTKAVIAPCFTTPLEGAALAAFKRRIALRATVLVCNLCEAETLTGMQVEDTDTARHAADMLLTLGAEAVAIGEENFCLVATAEEEYVHQYPADQADKQPLGAAVALGLLQAESKLDAVKEALHFLHSKDAATAVTKIRQA